MRLKLDLADLMSEFPTSELDEDGGGAAMLIDEDNRNDFLDEMVEWFRARVDAGLDEIQYGNSGTDDGY